MKMPSNNTIQDPKRKDPRSQGPKPEFSQETIPYPGSTDAMSPRPDHGEETYEGLGRLKDKVALITGADSGIGRAVAIAFAREGADIVLGYLPDEEKDATESAGWIRRAGRKALQIPGDISSEQNCVALAESAMKEFGQIDALVNIAAFQSTHEELNEITSEEFDRTLKTNVYALFWLCRAIMPAMRPGSVVINTASIQSYDPSAHLLPYAATKAAIVSMTKTLSMMGMKGGVRVNAVAPGPVWTPLIPATMSQEKAKKFGHDTDFGRPAQPVEIAPVFVFLASNEARYVTGEVYGITGGQSPV
jgi:NAD(P)-dependent dehydrogenase (short-subunit alcohol dehydrogenase family)